jgi:hypothetical protein
VQVGADPRSRLRALFRRATEHDARDLLVISLLLALLGGALRYYDLSDQILLGDEWHSLERASRYSLGKLATTYFRKATAIPLNVYHGWLLTTFGWSELSLKVPTLLATLATLLVFPSVVFRRFGSKWVALSAGVLFAASPFWIYYGQNARPYAPYFLALLLTYACFLRALSEPGLGSWVGFAISGAIAAYFHLYALPALAALALFAFVRLLILLRRGHSDVSPSPARRFFIGGCVGFGGLALLLGILYGRAALRGFEKNLPTGDEARPYDAHFWNNAVELLTGFTSTPLAWIGIVCAIAGLVLLSRRHPSAVGMLVLAVVVTTLFTAIVRPTYYYIALVALRYDVSLFLLYFLGVGALVHEIVMRLQRALASRFGRASEAWVGYALLVIVACVAILLSPLPRNLSIVPNNFKQHSAFAEYYSNWNPGRVARSDFFGKVDTRRAANIPAFYKWLAKEQRACRLLEYPLDIRDEYDPYYFYQIHHGCEVVIGFSRGERVGRMLNVEATHEKLRFKRAIWVDDLARIRASRADFLIVHLNVRDEVERHPRPTVSAETRRVIRFLESRLGAPTYEDRYLRVFRISRR